MNTLNIRRKKDLALTGFLLITLLLSFSTLTNAHALGEEGPGGSCVPDLGEVCMTDINHPMFNWDEV